MARRRKNKSTKSGKSTSKANRREEALAAAARRRRNQNLMVGAAGALIVLLIGAVIYANIRSSMPVGEEEVFPTQGNLHIPFGSTSPVEYNSVPPTSGPHYDGIVAWNIYTQPYRYEHLVHNLEDGGVLVYYQCEDSCPELLQELEDVVEPFIQAGEHVAVVPNDPTWSPTGGTPLHKDMGAPIALVAWRHLMLLDEVDEEMIRAFIQRYEGIDNHPRN